MGVTSRTTRRSASSSRRAGSSTALISVADPVGVQRVERPRIEAGPTTSPHGERDPSPLLPHELEDTGELLRGIGRLLAAEPDADNPPVAVLRRAADELESVLHRALRG
jgi:hypothetical protein